MKTIKLAALTPLLLIAPLAHAGTIADGDLVTFSANTTAKAAEVNQNFTAIKNAVNGSAADIATLQTNVSRLFAGDGSAGDLTVSSDTNWGTTPPTNLAFQNITIAAGRTLTVPAGTTIRCSGSFVNNGTLFVSFGAESDGAFNGLSTPGGPPQGITALPHPGDTPRAASMGQWQPNGDSAPVTLGGGVGGKAIPVAVATTSFNSFRLGGGAGGAYDTQGGQGGGLVKIYCNGSITNNGTISAIGVSGANQTIGGGGGGIVVLASGTLVDNTSGTINVSGGNGAPGGSFGGNGGGGGGGIIVMVSPTAPIAGTTAVGGGTGGTSTNPTTSPGRAGGSGGGGSGGAGGNGSTVTNTGANTAAQNGGAGYVVTLTAHPAQFIQ